MIPPYIERIFDKPGCDWLPAERGRVKKWLNEDWQLQYLLVFVLRCLGARATPEDAEETWQEFCTERLDSVIDSYNPAKERRFWNYLLFCLERHCWDEGEKIRRRLQHEQPLERKAETEEGEHIELEPMDENPGSRPEEALMGKELIASVNKALKELPNSNHMQTFILCHLEGFSREEVAEILHCPVGSVKGWLFRAQHQLANSLRKEGWEL